MAGPRVPAGRDGMRLARGSPRGWMACSPVVSHSRCPQRGGTLWHFREYLHWGGGELKNLSQQWLQCSQQNYKVPSPDR